MWSASVGMTVAPSPVSLEGCLKSYFLVKLEQLGGLNVKHSLSALMHIIVKKTPFLSFSTLLGCKSPFICSTKNYYQGSIFFFQYQQKPSWMEMCSCQIFKWLTQSLPRQGLYCVVCMCNKYLMSNNRCGTSSQGCVTRVCFLCVLTDARGVGIQTKSVEKWQMPSEYFLSLGGNCYLPPVGVSCFICWV